MGREEEEEKKKKDACPPPSLPPQPEVGQMRGRGRGCCQDSAARCQADLKKIPSENNFFWQNIQ